MSVSRKFPNKVDFKKHVGMDSINYPDRWHGKSQYEAENKSGDEL